MCGKKVYRLIVQFILWKPNLQQLSHIEKMMFLRYDLINILLYILFIYHLYFLLLLNNTFLELRAFKLYILFMLFLYYFLFDLPAPTPYTYVLAPN